MMQGVLDQDFDLQTRVHVLRFRIQRSSHLDPGELFELRHAADADDLLPIVRPPDRQRSAPEPVEQDGPESVDRGQFLSEKPGLVN